MACLFACGVVCLYINPHVCQPSIARVPLPISNDPPSPSRSSLSLSIFPLPPDLPSSSRSSLSLSILPLPLNDVHDMGSSSLNTNAPNALRHITAGGSDWLWAVFAVMAICDLAMIAWSFSVRITSFFCILTTAADHVDRGNEAPDSSTRSVSLS